MNLMLTNRPLPMRRTQRGQTLVVALIIMGLLLIIGFIFIGILNRNIRTAGRMQNRSLENDLSEAGIRFAHAMLLNSEEGADWRGAPSPILGTTGNQATDPDLFYLRPASFGLNFRPGQPDMGGPDGLGPYSRVNYRNGRALVRVRYGPSDINIFNTSPTGALRNPGLARNYLVLESVGRQGAVNPRDPTTLPSTAPVQFTGFATDAALQQAVSLMASKENTANRAVNRAFASIGIIESALFITNKYNVTRPAELGIASELGVTFGGLNVADTLPQVIGTQTQLYTPGANPVLTAGQYAGFGSVVSNADLRIYGNLLLNLNKTLGDKLVVNGRILSADTNSDLRLNVTEINAGNWVTNTVNVGQIDSNGAFSTFGGMIADGYPGADAAGYSRGVGRKAPPSIDARDSNTGINRYVAMTRDSGVISNGANNGVLGYGQGPYIGNASERQAPEGEIGKAILGSESSLEYDWLNPGNGKANSGWKGFLYAPMGAYLQLVDDGFLITRSDQTWRAPDGTDTGQSTIRYRLGFADGQIHIVNTFTPGVNINLASLGPAAYRRGPVFNGVLYFEGNVRVRGIIPTDAQLTVVSNATIYIEGSITKGVSGNGLQTDAAAGNRLTRPSRSMLMLMAKDYVALNTTQFFGSSPSQVLEPVASSTDVPGFSPLLLRTGGNLKLQSSFVLDPSTNPTNPSTWQPYAANYVEYGTGTPLTTNLLISHTMENGAASAAFLQLAVNRGVFDTATPPAPVAGPPNPNNLPESTYLFPLLVGNMMNTLLPAPLPPAFFIYAFGSEPVQRFGKFETALFPLVDPTQLNTANAGYTVSTGNQGAYRLFTQGTNDFDFSLTNYGATSSGNYIVGKASLVPHDVVIEASVYAEDGSFFVIPGQWTNPNPNDRRDTYDAAPGTIAEKDQQRLLDYGAYPGTPFFGEAPDIRVTLVGAVSQNMTPSMDKQSEWLRKWGWIPKTLGASGVNIPAQHVPAGTDPAALFVPNLSISYDPVLATARPFGFNNDAATNPIIRTDSYGRALPPLPRLPVSPELAFFGEVR